MRGKFYMGHYYFTIEIPWNPTKMLLSLFNVLNNIKKQKEVLKV